ncbi:MAG: DUF3604 domain-containing protein, partial [Desulfobacterales bacterium]
MKSCRIISLLVTLGLMLGANSSPQAITNAYMQKDEMKPAKKEFSPYANRGYPTRVFFGDTHLHTSLSVDAGAFGNRLG